MDSRRGRGSEAGKRNNEGENGSSESDEVIKEQDQLLPIANVGRIMKNILPPNAKISKDARQTMQECVSEFISFVTGEASDKCRKEKRKTVNGDDICWALGALGLDDHAEAARKYLQKYRIFETDKAESSRGAPADPRAASHRSRPGQKEPGFNL